MATSVFYGELEATIQLLMRARDEQTVGDRLVTDGDINAQAEADIQARTDRILEAAVTKVASLDRDMT